MCTSNFTRDNANKGKQDSLKTKVDKNQQEIDKENEISLTNKYKQLGVKAKAYENLKSLTTQIGELSENKSKNRFINILPYDQTRVKLIKESHGSDYINANYIPFMNNINEYEYIASQGPIDETISHFWQMIWENNISIIIMLTRTYEEDKFKCLQYWPNNKFQHEEFGQKKEFIVSIMEENVKNAFVERKLKILNKEENLERSLIHLHMVEWFDYSAPKLEDFEQLLFRFQEIVLQKDYHPYLIHCSAGVGRTGTFIVLDRIIRELIDGNKNIDISHQILELRKYRKFMVQRAAQFIFIHDFYQYFLNKYTCPGDINEENIYFNST